MLSRLRSGGQVSGYIV